MIKELIFNSSRWWKIESNANISFDDNKKPVFKWTRVSTGTCKRASYSRYGTEENIKANFSDWNTFGPSKGKYIGRAYIDFNDIGRTEIILYQNEDDMVNPFTFVRAEDAIISENGGVTSLLTQLYQGFQCVFTPRKAVRTCL